MQQHDVQNYGIQHNGIHNHKQNQCTQPYKKKHNGTHQYGTQQHCIQHNGLQHILLVHGHLTSPFHGGHCGGLTYTNQGDWFV